MLSGGMKMFEPSSREYGDFPNLCSNNRDKNIRNGIMNYLLSFCSNPTRRSKILGTIARRETKIGDLDGDYLEDRVSFSEDKLMYANSRAIMMAWEKPLMEAHAKAICSRGGHILNIRFRMGLMDTAIQQYKPVTQTIVEAHPELYE
ncbi:hypothetical protein L1887_32018 [Cichorium endivia]|nr:hypothetical protein L1887_32018 [Cichorium endivia]